METKEEIRRVFVTGHRNPDIDSLASAAALAELRKRQGVEHMQALCCGVMPERARYLFDRFKFPYPESRNDVYLRIGDVMSRELPLVQSGTTLFEAVGRLSESGFARLPVVDADGRFLGMLSPMTLLSQLLSVGSDGESGLTGREVRSSIGLIARVIAAKVPSWCDAETLHDFLAYVAAMGVESLEEHLPKDCNSRIALIVGDRSEIHLRALRRKIPLLIVTGSKPVEPLIMEEAKRCGVAILKTALDSASVIRRLKFSVPVEISDFGKPGLLLDPAMRLRGLENRILNQSEDVIPVVSGDGHFAGAVLKSRVRATPPYRLVMVDHNEIEQSIPGAEEIPVVEVVDHHRIGMMPTANPIRFTGDVVGSTCTLVASMFRSAGESVSADLAGLLLGGIAADTLNLKSPTTSPLDRRMVEWLEKLSGVKASEIMDGFAAIGSPLSGKSAEEVIDGDRKNYQDGAFKFALSQVEESNLALFHRRKAELFARLEELLKQEQLSFAGLLVTDAVRGNSELLIAGDSAVIRNLPFERRDDSLFSLPGVLSRKKQLLPQVLAVLSLLASERA